MKTSIHIIILLLVCSSCKSQPEGSYEQQREQMVKYQIELRGISKPDVIKAMQAVPRHKFVPLAYRHLSYQDTPLPIGEGQTISQPYIVAFMTEKLDLAKSDKVLEIGTGSGYQAAVLAEICDTVYTIEIFETLANRAKNTLKESGYHNVIVKHGDGYQGWKEHAPFDAIIVTCAPEEIPLPLEEQLREGGRMIIPVGRQYTQELYLLKKKNEKIRKHAVLPVRFVPMIDDEGVGY